jgi:hypothetical protein
LESFHSKLDFWPALGDNALPKRHPYADFQPHAEFEAIVAMP